MRRTGLMMACTCALAVTACGGDDDDAVVADNDSSTATTAAAAPTPTIAATTPPAGAPDVVTAGMLEGTLVIEGEVVEVGPRENSNNWCDYYEGQSLGIAGQAEGADPFFQLNHDQLKVNIGESSFYTLPDEKILTIDDEFVVGSDTGGTITVTHDGDALALVFDGQLQGIGSNSPDDPALIAVQIDIACER